MRSLSCSGFKFSYHSEVRRNNLVLVLIISHRSHFVSPVVQMPLTTPSHTCGCCRSRPRQRRVAWAGTGILNSDMSPQTAHPISTRNRAVIAHLGSACFCSVNEMSELGRGCENVPLLQITTVWTSQMKKMIEFVLQYSYLAPLKIH